MDWKFYAANDFGLYQYDMEGVSHLSNNIVRVSQKLILNDRGTTKLARELGREYENVKEIITMREIDCTGKKSHILGSIYFSDSGGVIKRESYEPIEWDSIIPDSVDDVLYHAVCKSLKSTPIWN
jgi:Surface-adhesin protein E